MSNIAEGFERGSNTEFRQFLCIARGSAGELRSLFYVARDAGYVSPEQFDALSGDAREISKKLAGLIRYLGGTDIRGPKHL